VQRQCEPQQPASDPERLHLVRPSPWPRRIVIFLAIWTAVVSWLILLAVWKNPIQRAVLGMAWGLILIWIGGCGLVMRRLRNQINEAARRVKLAFDCRLSNHQRWRNIGENQCAGGALGAFSGAVSWP
jgi:hypothetical protein